MGEEFGKLGAPKDHSLLKYVKVGDSSISAEDYNTILTHLRTHDPLLLDRQVTTRDYVTVFNASETTDIKPYSVFGFSKIHDIRQNPVVLRVDVLRKSVSTVMLTNNSRNLKSLGGGYAEQLDFVKPLMLQINPADNPPTAGSLCGPNPEKFYVSANYSGLVAVSDAFQVEGLDVMWFLRCQIEALLVRIAGTPATAVGSPLGSATVDAVVQYKSSGVAGLVVPQKFNGADWTVKLRYLCNEELKVNDYAIAESIANAGYVITRKCHVSVEGGNGNGNGGGPLDCNQMAILFRSEKAPANNDFVFGQSSVGACVKFRLGEKCPLP